MILRINVSVLPASHNAWELKEEAGWLRQALDPPDLGQKQFPLDCQMELPYRKLYSMLFRVRSLSRMVISPAHLRFEPLLAPASQSRSEGCDDLLLQHAGTFCL